MVGGGRGFRGSGAGAGKVFEAAAGLDRSLVARGVCDVQIGGTALTHAELETYLDTAIEDAAFEMCVDLGERRVVVRA